MDKDEEAALNLESCLTDYDKSPAWRSKGAAGGVLDPEQGNPEAIPDYDGEMKVKK